MNAANPTGRRVLLVEDDASIARFVGMALEDQGVDFSVCADVGGALAALQDRPVQLIITDLMLPGLSGYDLVDRLHAAPALLGAARVVIFSAGISADNKEWLEGRGVWRILRKPASVAQLQACVQDAFVGPLDAAQASPGAPQDKAASAGEDGDAVLAYFGGDVALFQAYRARCLVQFAHDLASGDGALQAADLASLQRLSHSLATVFRTLGWAGDGAMAKQLEALAAAGDAPASAIVWSQLRRRLLDPGTG